MNECRELKFRYALKFGYWKICIELKKKILQIVTPGVKL